MINICILSNTLGTLVQSNQVKESVSDLERDGNDVRMDDANETEDDEEVNNDAENEDADEEANEDEDGVEDETDFPNMRSEDENDGEIEDGTAKLVYAISLF